MMCLHLFLCKMNKMNSKPVFNIPAKKIIMTNKPSYSIAIKNNSLRKSQNKFSNIAYLIKIPKSLVI